MNAEIISIGTELLMGQIVDTNSAYLARKLKELSIPLYAKQTVGDNVERLIHALELARSRSQIVIMTGGLGPTTDDLTKEVVAQFLHQDLVEDRVGLEKIEQFFVKRNQGAMTPNNKRQAWTFKQGVTFQNSNGLAVGSYIEQDGIHYFLLPGPPYEMEKMFEEEILPFLKRKFATKKVFVSRFMRFFGIGESRLVTELADLIDQQDNPTLAPYAGRYEVVLRATANADNPEECDRLLNQMEETIQEKVGNYLYGYGEHGSLALSVKETLENKGLNISVAESLTGGLCQASLVECAGISTVFKGGIVTYHSDTKHEVLGVPLGIIQEFGVVSDVCAKEMAHRVRELFQTDIGLSFTGVAGPDSLEGKEAGTIYIGFSTAEKDWTVERHYHRQRQGNREYAVLDGFNELLKYLKG